MALRICLVTPFAWSQPHDVNEHVAGIARELRALGHAVTIIASSNRAAELAAGRVALHNGSFDGEELVIVGPAVPISRRSRIGVPVGVRTNLSRALRFGRFDVVHGFEPGLPSLSYLALRDAESLAVATFFSPERLSYPPGRAQRERLLGRIDQLLAASEETAAAAAGAAVASPPGMQEQPQLAAAEMGRLADDETYRVRGAAGARAEAERQTFLDVAHELEAIYEDVRTRKRSARREAEPLGDRD